MLEVSFWDGLERWGKGRQGTKSRKNKEEQDKGVERGKYNGAKSSGGSGIRASPPFLMFGYLKQEGIFCSPPERPT